MSAEADPYESLVSSEPDGAKKASAAYSYTKKKAPWWYFVLGLCLIGLALHTMGATSGQSTLASRGISLTVLAPGDGKTYPKVGDTVSVDYIGTLASNGKKIDSSYDRKDTFDFVLGEELVIAGWEQGLLKMSLNETSRLWIPSHLAYGEKGMGEAIPPNADLSFDIHLVAINHVEIERHVSIIPIVPGDGVTFPKHGDVVTVHYIGTFVNGDKFDSSRDRGSPFSFTIGKRSVIKGWEEGIPQLSMGETAKLVIPYQLAYGEQGRSGIPPKSDLIFEVELLSIESS